MLTWISAAPTFLIALLLVFVPGVVVASAGGARGLQRWAIAAPLSFTLAGVGAIVFEILNIPFTWLNFLVAFIVAAALCVGVRMLLARLDRTPTSTWGTGPAFKRERWPEAQRGVWLLVCTVSAIYATSALAWRIMRGVGAPENIAQLFDNVFHLNAVRLIANTQLGSSLTLGNLNEASRSFYPAAFHDLTALVMTVAGVDPAVALNVTSIVLACVVWPISLIFLATRLFGERPIVVVAAAMIAPALGSFPYRMLSFGVLYPFMAGLCMLPVVLALLIDLFGVSRSAPTSTVIAAIAVAATGPGVALTHPSVIIAAIAFSTPFAAHRIFISLRSASLPVKERAIIAGFGAAYLLLAAGAFILVRPPLSSAPWSPTQSYKEAMGALLTLSPGIVAVQWGVFAFSVIGVVACVRDWGRLWPLATLAGIGAIFYFASAAFPDDLPRDLLSGVWYTDTQRLAALFAIASAPLAILGFITVCRAIASAAPHLRRFRFTGDAGRVTLSIASVVLVAIACIALTQRGPVSQAEEWIAMSFGNRSEPALLDDDERLLLAQVPEIVPKNETVLGSPRTGASLVYAFSNRWTVAPHIFGVRTEEEQFLLDHWDEAGSNPDVCPVIRDLSAYWALDFGATDVLGVAHEELAGTDALSSGEARGITRTASVGEVALYEASVCR